MSTIGDDMKNLANEFENKCHRFAINTYIDLNTKLKSKFGVETSMVKSHDGKKSIKLVMTGTIEHTPDNEESKLNTLKSEYMDAVHGVGRYVKIRDENPLDWYMNRDLNNAQARLSSEINNTENRIAAAAADKKREIDKEILSILLSLKDDLKDIWGNKNASV